MAPTLDIVVPAFGNPDITARTLASLTLFRPVGTRVVLVDNGSLPELPLRSYCESAGIDFLRLDENRGPYGAVNAGLIHFRRDAAPVWGVVCNDAVPAPLTLAKLLKEAQAGRPYVAAREAQAPSFDGDALAAYRGDPGLSPRVFFTCFVATRELLTRVGSFDERFRLTYGDTDWEQRAADVLGGPQHLLTRLDAPCYHGASVTRKRLGVEADVTADCADQKRFLEKWRDRPDIMARHQVELPEFKRSYLIKEWARVGEQ